MGFPARDRVFRHDHPRTIIPEAHGGLGFSAFAHSDVARFLATRSSVAAVTVMVPNSLGPGELILQFGTQSQKDYWPPRLADGRELPALGLASDEAGRRHIPSGQLFQNGPTAARSRRPRSLPSRGI